MVSFGAHQREVTAGVPAHRPKRKVKKLMSRYRQLTHRWLHLPPPTSDCEATQDASICGSARAGQFCDYPRTRAVWQLLCPVKCNSCKTTTQSHTTITTVATTASLDSVDTTKPHPTCTNVRREWIFRGKCHYAMRCRRGKVDRLDATVVNCNCNTVANDGVSIDKSCYSCTIYAGAISAAKVQTGPSPLILASGIHKARFEPFKTDAIKRVDTAWFKCFACRDSRLMYQGACISPDQCLAKAKAEGLVIYSLNQYNGQCVEPFQCVDGATVLTGAVWRSAATGRRCKCPRVMNGCSSCNFGGSWFEGGRLHHGPHCTSCGAGKFLVHSYNYKYLDKPAYQLGIGRCLTALQCVKQGGMPNEQTWRCDGG